MVPIQVLSEMITLEPIIEFFIITLFLIIESCLILTPRPIKQFLPINTELSIDEYLEI